MFELITKKRNNLKKNKKGFTLVEVIVVLVILAILAAILVPAMIGWINKANEKTAMVEARNVLLALQTVASDTYNPKATDNNQTKINNENLNSVTYASVINDMKNLTDDQDIANEGVVTKINVLHGKITGFIYTNADFKVTYAAGNTGSDKFAVDKK